MEKLMLNRNARYAHLLTAAAGLIAAVPAIHASAWALPAGDADPKAWSSASATAQIDRAADLLAKNKPVQARLLLLPLADDAAAVGLSDADRHRVFTLLT